MNNIDAALTSLVLRPPPGCAADLISWMPPPAVWDLLVGVSAGEMMLGGEDPDFIVPAAEAIGAALVQAGVPVSLPQNDDGPLAPEEISGEALEAASSQLIKAAEIMNGQTRAPGCAEEHSIEYFIVVPDGSPQLRSSPALAFQALTGTRLPSRLCVPAAYVNMPSPVWRLEVWFKAPSDRDAEALGAVRTGLEQLSTGAVDPVTFLACSDNINFADVIGPVPRSARLRALDAYGRGGALSQHFSVRSSAAVIQAVCDRTIRSLSHGLIFTDCGGRPLGWRWVSENLGEITDALRWADSPGAASLADTLILSGPIAPDQEPAAVWMHSRSGADAEALRAMLNKLAVGDERLGRMVAGDE